MNTNSFFYIFALLTGTVLAHEVPPIVSKVLTQEEQRNTQEGKEAFNNIKEHLETGNTPAMMKALGFALQNDKDKNAILEQLHGKQIVKKSWEDQLLEFVMIAAGFCLIYQLGYCTALRRELERGIRMQNQVNGPVGPQHIHYYLHLLFSDDAMNVIQEIGE